MMIAPEENLTTRVYNVAGMSFTPDILYNEVKKHVPNLAIEYNIDDRQKIGKIQIPSISHNSPGSHSGVRPQTPNFFGKSRTTNAPHD